MDLCDDALTRQSVGAHDGDAERVSVELSRAQSTPNKESFIALNPLHSSVEIARDIPAADETTTRQHDEEPAQSDTSTTLHATNNWFDINMFIKMFSISTLFSFPLIAIPLGHGSQINPIAFCVLQVASIPFNLVTEYIVFQISVPKLPVGLKWAAFFVAMGSQLVIAVCYVHSIGGSNDSLLSTAGFGLTSFGLVMAVGMIMFTLTADTKFEKENMDDRKEEIKDIEKDKNSIHFCMKGFSAPDRRSNPSTASGASATDQPNMSDSVNRSSILRMIELAAGVEATDHCFEYNRIQKLVVGFSCAYRNSVWRTPLKPASASTLRAPASTSPSNALDNGSSSASDDSWAVRVIIPAILSLLNLEGYGGENEFQLIGRAAYQAVRIIIAQLVRYSLFFFTQWLARDFSESTAPYGEIGYYLLFIAGLSVFRLCFHFLGLWLDMYKTGGLSIQYFLTLWITIYYAVFFRGLFVTVRSYGAFFSIKAVHICWEMLSYGVRYSDVYGKCINWAHDYLKKQRKYPSLFRSLAVIAIGPPLNVTQQRSDIALGLRLYVMLYTTVTFMAYFSFLRFGYNRQFFCLFRTISAAQYQRLMIFTTISIGLELVMFMLINQFSKRDRGYSALSVWQRFLTGQFDTPWRVNIVVLIVASAHVVVDYYLSRIDLSSLGSHQINC